MDGIAGGGIGGISAGVAEPGGGGSVGRDERGPPPEGGIDGGAGGSPVLRNISNAALIPPASAVDSIGTTTSRVFGALATA